jgi:hypothetical protein
VLLLTDGHANRGVSEDGAIVRLLKGCLGSDGDNISVNVMGYGSDHNADLLQSLSQVSETSGSYYFIEHADNVSSAFGDCLGGLLSVSAQNIRVKIQGEGVAVLHDKAVKAADDSYVVSLGDMFADETKDIVMTGPAVATTVRVQVEYLDVVNARPVVSQVTECTVTVGGALGGFNKHVAVQVLRVQVVRAMQEAHKLARGGLEAARAKMTETIAEIQRVRQQMGSVSAEEAAALDTLLGDCNDALSSMSSMYEYEGRGSKTMMSKMQMHSAQRCNASGEEANMYRAARSKKASMVTKFAGMSR